MAAQQNSLHPVVRASFLFSTALCALTAVSPLAAQQTAEVPDAFLNTEEHGVDLVTGRYYLDIVEGRIGPADGGISLVRHYGGAGLQDNWTGTLVVSGSSATVRLGKIAETFTLQSGSWVSNKANGGKLVAITQGWRYTASDGTQIEYKKPEALSLGLGDANTQYGGPGCSSGSNCGLPTKVTRPSGVVYTLNWEVTVQCFQDGQPVVVGGGGLGGGEGSEIECFAPFRLVSVTSNSSYAMVFEFDSDQSSFNAGFPAPAWYNRKSVTLFDTSQVACLPGACSPSGTNWPKVTYARPSSNVLEINNSQAGTWRITTGTNTISVRRPGRTSDTLVITRDSSNRVTSIVDDGETKNYSWSTVAGDVAVTMSDASGSDGQVISDPAVGRPTAITDAVGETTEYSYDANDRLTRITYPLDNYVEYTRDDRGNITNTRWVARPGTSDGDIQTSADFDATCADELTCNKPNFTIDANGNRTDYTYSSVHGGVTRIERPAPSSGQPRPRTDIVYSELYAQTRNASGQLVNQSQSQWRPTLYTTCQTASTCPASANEQRVAIAYNTPNLLPSSVTVSSGDGAIVSTTAFAYPFIPLTHVIRASHMSRGMR